MVTIITINLKMNVHQMLLVIILVFTLCWLPRFLLNIIKWVHLFESSLHWWYTGGLASSTRILISSWTNPSSISKLLPNSSLSSMPWWIQSYTGANKFCNKKNKENTKNSSLMSGSVRRSVLGCCARILRPTTPHQVTIMTIVKTRWKPGDIIVKTRW